MTGFLILAVLITAAAVSIVAVPMVRNREDTSPAGALVSALAIPAAAVLLYSFASNYPWLVGTPISPGNSAGLPASGSAPVVADSAAVAALRAAADASPQEATPQVDLANGLLAEERFADAAQAYAEAIRLSGGGDDELRLAFAEASILADRSNLVGDAGRIIDDVLFRQPFNPKALWYGGMAALGRGDAATARDRWNKLLDLSPPPQIRQIIEQQLANLRPPGGGGSGPAASPAASSVSLPVRVSIKPELLDRVRSGAVLFVFVRAPGATGPPLAAVRRELPELPLSLVITDADVMMPGGKLGDIAEVEITARLANGGDARAVTGDVFGSARWRPGADPLELVINQVTP